MGILVRDLTFFSIFQLFCFIWESKCHKKFPNSMGSMIRKQKLIDQLSYKTSEIMI